MMITKIIVIIMIIIIVTIIKVILMAICNAPCLSLSDTPGAGGPSFSFHLKNIYYLTVYQTLCLSIGPILFSIYLISLGHILRQHNINDTLQKKVMQHEFDRLYFFYPGFSFMKLDIHRKPVYLPSIDALFVRIVSLGRVQGE